MTNIIIPKITLVLIKIFKFKIIKNFLNLNYLYKIQTFKALFLLIIVQVVVTHIINLLSKDNRIFQTPQANQLCFLALQKISLKVILCKWIFLLSKKIRLIVFIQNIVNLIKNDFKNKNKYNIINIVREFIMMIKYCKKTVLSRKC